MLQALLVNLMVPGQYSVLSVEGEATPLPMSVSVKLHLGGVVQEPPSPTMGR